MNRRTILLASTRNTKKPSYGRGTWLLGRLRISYNIDQQTDSPEQDQRKSLVFLCNAYPAVETGDFPRNCSARIRGLCWTVRDTVCEGCRKSETRVDQTKK
ncbi:hypothetical protein FOQG_08332 [Fusarium oxysporum f. sp. raphani 54005]|uniref:Uncharacterized protein n=1 Tax=Fusarium oxysporum f. sp. raphani 54005 TaxID=1089458 RepID=X0C277_FUSOX|nr:hypothetical protein FOQG_08332 [Fusarium oxysporum f. sp. raphani 54005]